MDSENWLDVLAGTIVIISSYPFSGGTIAGGVLIGYLGQKTPSKGAVYGTLAGVLAISLLYIHSITSGLISGDTINWWHLAFPLVSNLGSILLFAGLGGIIGCYVRKRLIKTSINVDK